MHEIDERVPRVPQNVIDRLASLSTSIIGDAMGRYGCMESPIKPLSDHFKLAGPAVTVRTYRADNLMMHVGLEMAQEGDVLVVDACGFCDTGLWGALMSRMAIQRKIAGIVLDGAARDKLEIRGLGFPVFCRALSPMGGVKASLGAVNVPIACAGVPVSPGDIIVADADGVVVVPALLAAEIADKAEEQDRKERELVKRIGAGESLFQLLRLNDVLTGLGSDMKPFTGPKNSARGA